MTPTGRIGGSGWREWVPLLVVAAAVWLAWQCIAAVGIERLPPGLALRVAGNSPQILTRAAEVEFGASRFQNSGSLARDALARAPFNVRALRIIGLSAARSGQNELADNLITLAGNWSLRDDPAHAWLVETRLRQGDYASAFAHADTLARRREDLYPMLFKLFQSAAELDPRAVRPLGRLLEPAPPWRGAFMVHMNQSDSGLRVAVALAALLETSPEGRFRDGELTDLYAALINRGFAPSAADLRRRLQRPPSRPILVNGEFSGGNGVPPFDWVLFSEAGVVAMMMPDDSREGESVLQVSYDGFTASPVAEQITALPPGRYRFGGQSRTEAGAAGSRLVWAVNCFGGAEIGRQAALSAERGWRPFTFDFEVPSRGCDLQLVRLSTRAEDRRSENLISYDNLAILPR